MKQIEVEVRGRLTKQKFEDLAAKFEEGGKFVENRHRILIDYSTCLESESIKGRTRDIRLRVTNGQPEIITKLGAWGGQDSRKELSVKTTEGSFDTLVETYAVLGYSKGMLCVRDSKAYLYKDIEFALVEVPGHSYYFEAEILVDDKSEVIDATDRINNEVGKLGLESFTSQEFCDYIELLNQEANELFDFEEVEAGYFTKRFSL